MDHQAAIEILRTSDSFRLAETIQTSGSPAQIGEIYSQLGLDLYWKSKNLGAVVAVLKMGIHYCLTQSRDGAIDADVRAKLLDSSKKMAFNLASFCWPGWDEPGISIRDCDIETGADAARLNLRLADELKRPAPGMSMAHWMLGGYALARRQFDRAAEDFQKSLEFAREAKNDGHAMLIQGNLALARLGKKSPGAVDEFMKVIQSLDAVNDDNSREYSRQLQVARKVFGL